MKNGIYTWFFLILPCLLFGQSFSNDWIDYDKQYYKIRVYENGIYRVYYQTLLNAGIPVNSINPQQFQIFSRGKEQYIYVEGTGTTDTVFAPGEFIEFYGEKNTGWLDTVWYADPGWHANPNVSLYTDTAIYFLTWESSGSTKRLVSENDIDFSGYSPADYFLYESRQDFDDYFYGGTYTANLIYDSEFTEGEGWFGPSFSGTYIKTISTSKIYSSGPDAVAKCVLIGTNLQEHVVSVQIGSGTTYNLTYSSIKVNKLNYNIPLVSLGSTNTNFTFIASGQSPDRNAVGYISIKYAHTFDFGGVSSFKMHVLDGQTKSYLNIANFDVPTSTCWLYDLTNHLRIKTQNGATLKVLVPNSGGEKECYLAAESAINTITDLLGVGILGNAKFTDYTNKDPDSAFLIISNEQLYNDGNGNNYVNDYRLYRESQDGGGNNVELANIDELYDQFAYGIRKNPMAIRGFCEYTLQNWTTPPQYLLLIGKSISNRESRINTTYYANNLVPTFGYPPSDNLLTAGLVGTTWEPAIATGRIAASKWEDVTKYLGKLEEFDANQMVDLLSQIKSEQEWKKQIIHLAGGVGSQNTTFRNYLKGYEQIIEDTSFGGKVHTFSKNTSAPIQITVFDSIANLINDGVSMITFFGHASGGGFDQNIDNPDSYSNKDGKYPLLIANSCLVGDIHMTSNNSNSEIWTLNERGVIGFLATVALGEQGALNNYTKELYVKIGQTMYGESIGKCIKSAIFDIKAQAINKNVCLQMTLHGDPSVVINTRPKPDYTITLSDVYTNPPNISAELDSFDLNMIVTNIGKAINNDLTLQVKRLYPPEANIQDSIYYLSFPATHYKDTLTLRLPVDIVNGVGLNKFDIQIDAFPQQVDELNEDNNDVLHTVWIKTDDIMPVYPYEYAVIDSPVTPLKASTGDPFAPIETYAFEIDTNNHFNPPMLSTTITHAGGLVVWDPANDPGLYSLLSGSIDSTVYFWRVRKDSTNINDTNHIWRGSSFQYISGKRGWGQAHFHQFENNQFNLLNYNKPDRKFDFVNTPKQLLCKAIGSINFASQYNSYQIDGNPQLNGSCLDVAAVIVVVIDPITLLPWTTTSNPGCPNPTKGFVFHISNSTQRANMAYFLADSVPVGHYILAYTYKYGLTASWDPALVLNAFLSLGWTEILNVGNYIPFAFFMKKGDPSTIIQNFGTSSTDTVNLTAQMQTNWDFGYMTSTVVGPTSNWESLHWKVKSLEPNDSVRLEVIGINNNGVESVIQSLQSLPPDTANIFNLNSIIDAAIYPTLKLRISMGDDSLKTAAQLSSWHVLLEEVPEAAINPSKFLSFYKDTLQEGEVMNLSVVIENISEFDMDSLLVSFWVIDKDRNMHTIPKIRYKPLLQSPDTILTSAAFSTKGYPGLNSLWVEVNPLNPTIGTFDQLEKYHFNNLVEKFFYVISDKTNPMVDVTFDGVHILDGDIVSTEPQIIIELRDENKYLPLDTNSLLEVYIKQPEETLYTLIPYDKNVLTFIPANMPDNKARVTYNPVFLKDGIYELIVQATDISKNESGDNKYVISFEVISKPTITSVMNWPNPFSTSTKFVFTLTGTDVPQDFRIRIMTISGRVVREIFAFELGPLHIGRNITQFAWDGTDEYGDQLANGIYLYKVDIRLNGNTMETRETNADQYFHKGYGKMYLMR